MKPTAALVPRKGPGRPPVGPIEIRMQISERMSDGIQAHAARNGVDFYTATRGLIDQALNTNTTTKED